MSEQSGWYEVLDIKSNKFYYHRKGEPVQWKIPGSEWRKFLDPATGKAYYCNVSNPQQIIWSLPSNVVVPPPATSIEASEVITSPRTSVAPLPPPVPTVASEPTPLTVIEELPASEEAPPLDAPPLDAPPLDAPPLDAPPLDAPPLSPDEGPPPPPDSSSGSKEKKKSWKIEALPEEKMWKDKFPFHAAAQGGDVVNLSRLLDQAGPEAKTLIDSLDGEDHWGALHYASWEGHKSVVAELIKRGANVSLQNANGSTALHYAAGVGHLQLVRKLLKHDADKTILDKEKRTPLKLVKELKPNNWEAISELLNN